jgi:hypothetical protein
LAIEVYSRQARNIENEKRAIEIRIRAERRYGELLRDTNKAKGNQNDGQFGGRVTPPPNSGAKTLSDLGISKDQSSRWQKPPMASSEVVPGPRRDPIRKPSTRQHRKGRSFVGLRLPARTHT